MTKQNSTLQAEVSSEIRELSLEEAAKIQGGGIIKAIKNFFSPKPKSTTVVTGNRTSSGSYRV